MGYFIRVRKSGWALLRTHYENGKCIGSMIPEKDLVEHLFNVTMTLEEAREQAKRLNKEIHEDSWLQKREAIRNRKKRELRERINHLPDILCSNFEEELLSRPDAKRMKSRWRAARKLIKTVAVPCHDWKRRSASIYNYFEEKVLSPDYAKKIIQVMNMWGEFYASKTDTPYQPLKCPSGYTKGRMLRAYRANQLKCKASDGLTLDQLRTLKNDLSTEQYNWVFISLWFGLRPQEMRNLNKGSRFTYFERDDENDIDILYILQTKLVQLPEEDQWKRIPILCAEQRKAVHMIQTGIFEEPLPKTIKRYTKGNHHLYAGRKGFGPLMWGLGHDVVEVSSWLGHKSIDRTYRDYMKWKRVKLRKSFCLTAQGGSTH